ncbi:MAG: hypothetical protein IJ723_01220 [Ruminococcus sp.]|nr:hypothetical protein [Ruminococcus sp.]
MPDSFEDMRQDAIRRVMDMQRRAENLAGGEPHTEHTASTEQQPRREHNAPPPAVPDVGGSLSDLLSGLNIDDEKALIALLIYILWKNGADKKLLFGLAYLIL